MKRRAVIVLRAAVAIERRGIDAREVARGAAQQIADRRDRLCFGTGRWRHASVTAPQGGRAAASTGSGVVRRLPASARAAAAALAA